MSKFFSLQRYAIYVLFAAALFGASAPVAKVLLERMSPVSLAALAYCGGGLALGIDARPQSIAAWRGPLLAPEPKKPGFLARMRDEAKDTPPPPRTARNTSIARCFSSTRS